MLPQGLHLHAGDGVVESLELVIPRDGSCNTGAGTQSGRVSGGKRQTGAKRSSGGIGPAGNAGSSAGATVPTASASSAGSTPSSGASPPPTHTRSSLPVKPQLRTAPVLPEPVQPPGAQAGHSGGGRTNPLRGTSGHWNCRRAPARHRQIGHVLREAAPRGTRLRSNYLYLAQQRIKKVLRPGEIVSMR